MVTFMSSHCLVFMNSSKAVRHTCNWSSNTVEDTERETLGGVDCDESTKALDDIEGDESVGYLNGEDPDGVLKDGGEPEGECDMLHGGRPGGDPGSVLDVVETESVLGGGDPGGVLDGEHNEVEILDLGVPGCFLDGQEAAGESGEPGGVRDGGESGGVLVR